MTRATTDKAAAKRSNTPATRPSRRAGPQRRLTAGVPGSGDHWLDDFIPYHLYRVTNKLNARLLHRLRTMRINPSQWRVLSVLKSNGPSSITDIVEATLMEQPTVSRVVSNLEREGRVTRRPSERDSRIAEISLTAKGVEAFNQIVPAALRHQELAFRNISAADIAGLVATLDKIESNIEADA
jgi:MarR family transcriptional regulator, organic hydroperoxide resistance regulator